MNTAEVFLPPLVPFSLITSSSKKNHKVCNLIIKPWGVNLPKQPLYWSCLIVSARVDQFLKLWKELQDQKLSADAEMKCQALHIQYFEKVILWFDNNVNRETWSPCSDCSFLHLKDKAQLPWPSFAVLLLLMWLKQSLPTHISSWWSQRTMAAAGNH